MQPLQPGSGNSEDADTPKAATPPYQSRCDAACVGVRGNGGVGRGCTGRCSHLSPANARDQMQFSVAQLGRLGGSSPSGIAPGRLWCPRTGEAAPGSLHGGRDPRRRPAFPLVETFGTSPSVLSTDDTDDRPLTADKCALQDSTLAERGLDEEEFGRLQPVYEKCSLLVAEISVPPQ